jgi:hypothetical protein
MQSIACNNKENGTGAICAFNTIGTVIYAIEYKFPSQVEMNDGYKFIVYETYEKLAGFDGSHMFIDENFIVQKAWHLKSGGLSVVANVWCRDTSNEQLHTQVTINSGPHMKPVIEQIRNHIKKGKSLAQLDERALKKTSNDFGTFAMTYFFDEDLKRNVLGIGSNDKTVGISLFSLYPSFSIYNNPDNQIKFDGFTVYANGDKTQGLNLQQMLTNGVPPIPPTPPSPNKNPSGWIFFVLLGVLILGSIIWFAYA